AMRDAPILSPAARRLAGDALALMNFIMSDLSPMRCRRSEVEFHILSCGQRADVHREARSRANEPQGYCSDVPNVQTLSVLSIRY
ncbi:MAG: hypothetical protein ACE5JF_13735, partial [Anaerolineales bacterium]